MAVGGKGNYLNNAVLNTVLNGAAFPTLPASVYVALFTIAPTDAGGGTEVSGGGYARVAVTRNTTNFPTTTTESISNATAITFPTSTASWGTVVAFGIFDAATGGNLLYWGPLSSNVAIGSSTTASFSAGALTVSEA